MSDKKGQFDGDGFESDPLTPIELRRHRHLFTVLDRNFVPMSQDEIQAVRFVSLLKKAWPFIGAAFAAGLGKAGGFF